MYNKILLYALAYDCAGRVIGRRVVECEDRKALAVQLALLSGTGHSNCPVVRVRFDITYPEAVTNMNG